MTATTRTRTTKDYVDKETEQRLGRLVRAGLAEGASESDQARGRAAEAEFARLFMSYARSIGGQLARQIGAEADDCESIALAELILSIRKFDPDQGCRFVTSADRRLRGAVLDNAPQEAEIVRTTRLARRVRTMAFDDLPQYVRRQAEGATASGRLRQALAMRRPVRIDKLVGCGFHSHSWNPLGEMMVDPALWAKQQREHPLASVIEAAINSLSPNPRRAFILYFGFGCEEKTMREIGDEIGISESRVSRLISQSKSHLRDHIVLHAQLREAI
jgi:RNA polymerase sigma factor (sigma-70 family)